jgi:hypothetical protein
VIKGVRRAIIGSGPQGGRTSWPSPPMSGQAATRTSRRFGRWSRRGRPRVPCVAVGPTSPPVVGRGLQHGVLIETVLELSDVGGPDYRRSDSLGRLRRLLNAVPRRAGSRAQPCHVAQRPTPERSPGTDPLGLPAADDGTIALTARAWAVWGTARTDQYARCLMRASKVVPSAGLVTPGVGASQRRRTAAVPELSPQCG